MHYNFAFLMMTTISVAGLAACGSRSDSKDTPVVSVKIDPEVDEQLFGSWFIVSTPLEDKDTGMPSTWYNARLTFTIQRDAIVIRNEITEADKVVCSVEAITRNFAIEKQRIIFNDEKMAKANGKDNFTCSVDIQKGFSEYKVVSADELSITNTQTKESSTVTRIK